MKIDSSRIDAVIFDLGGVLLNLDYQITINAFTELGLENVDHLFSQKKQFGFFDEFETGKINASEFRKELRALASETLTDTQIDAAWNAMLLDFPPNRFDFLKSISVKKRIFLLSNTNEIHMNWFKRYVNQLFGEDVFFDLFEVAYLSNEMSMRKPNVDIFDFVVNENKLNPERTLFIDDSPQHLDGAKLASLQTHWLQPNEEIVRLLGHFLT